MPLVVLAVLVASALPLFLVGFLVQSWVEDRTATPRPLFLLLSIAGVGGIGYALAALYLAHAGVGAVVSVALLIAAFGVLVSPSRRSRLRRLVGHRDVALPLVLLTGTAFFVLTLHLGTLPEPLPPQWNWTRHAIKRGLSAFPDNHTPLVFASRLYEAEDLREPVLRGHGSNRPPLQAGIVLVAYPAWARLERHAGPGTWIPAYYQVLGTLLQCSWVAAMYGLLRLLGLSRRRVALVVVALVPSHFFFFHAAYVWPKLLAGSLGVGAYCLVVPGRRRGDRVPAGRMAVAATLAALAFLSHGGVATSLIAVALVLSTPRWFPGWRPVLVGGLVAVAWVAPWLAYQRYYDPPGNYVAKRHLARVVHADDRTTWEAVRDFYTATTPEAFVGMKLRDLRILLGARPVERPIDDVPDLFATMQHYQSAHVFASFDVLNAGWIAAPLGLLLSRGRSRERWRRLAGLLALGVLCLAVWIGVQVSLPIIQHGSFAAMIFLFAGLTASIALLPVWLGAPILLLHGVLSLAIVQLSALRVGLRNEVFDVDFAGPTLAAAGVALALLLAAALRVDAGAPEAASGP